MDDILDDLALIVKRCKRAASLFEKEPVKTIADRVQKALDDVDASASGSWFGYHANVYYRNFEAPPPGDTFSVEWGLMERMYEQTSGNWIPVRYEDVERFVKQHSGVPDLDVLTETAKEIDAIVGPARRELLAMLDVLLSDKPDEALKEIRQQLAAHEDHLNAHKYMESRNPRHRMSRDSEAITQGVQAPPHVRIEATLMEEKSYAIGARKLCELAEQAMLYMQKKLKMKGKSVARTEGKVFIGHGRSKVWLELRNFLQDKLNLTVDEYDLEPTAGLSRKERLEAMLEDACFAFLVMTAEDMQPDGSVRARENVVHEIGLFQGRLGFKRAIVLMENGCNQFSNIEGIGQIRFPKDDIRSKSEDLREVLLREKIIR